MNWSTIQRSPVVQFNFTIGDCLLLKNFSVKISN